MDRPRKNLSRNDPKLVLKKEQHGKEENKCWEKALMGRPRSGGVWVSAKGLETGTEVQGFQQSWTPKGVYLYSIFRVLGSPGVKVHIKSKSTHRLRVAGRTGHPVEGAWSLPRSVKIREAILFSPPPREEENGM